MTSVNSILNQCAVADPLSLPLPNKPGSSLTESSATSCAVRLNQIVKQIQPRKARKIVGRVFNDLLRLLECLQPITDQLHRLDEVEETLALFQSIRAEARTLIKFIREEALACVEPDQGLHETLDGIAFAINHDLQRTFETGQPLVSHEHNGQSVSNLFRAHDLLANCLQQATISLATLLDPALVGTTLFNTSDKRYHESVQLCNDLATLLKLIDVCEETGWEEAIVVLRARVEDFRVERMRYLMYSDWPQFESFCERIRQTTTPELDAVIHQFRCYLETLLGQVKMRAVVAGTLPLSFEAEDLPHLSTTQINSAHFNYSEDFPDERVNWDSFAVAV